MRILLAGLLLASLLLTLASDPAAAEPDPARTESWPHCRPQTTGGVPPVEWDHDCYCPLPGPDVLGVCDL